MEAMTLERVRDALYAIHDEERPMPMRKEAREWAAVIGAHLAQPAQAVDVGAIRDALRVASEYEGIPLEEVLSEVRILLTRALSAQKAGPVGDGLPDENWFADQLCDLRNRWGEHEPSWLETDDNHPDDWMAKELRKRLLALPAYPTPDKEGA